MEKTHKNYKDYREGNAPLRNAVMQHPEGSEVYDFIQGQLERNFWVIPFERWTKGQKISHK